MFLFFNLIFKMLFFFKFLVNFLLIYIIWLWGIYILVFWRKEENKFVIVKFVLGIRGWWINEVFE